MNKIRFLEITWTVTDLFDVVYVLFTFFLYIYLRKRNELFSGYRVSAYSPVSHRFILNYCCVKNQLKMDKGKRERVLFCSHFFAPLPFHLFPWPVRPSYKTNLQPPQMFKDNPKSQRLIFRYCPWCAAGWEEVNGGQGCGWKSPVRRGAAFSLVALRDGRGIKASLWFTLASFPAKHYRGHWRVNLTVMHPARYDTHSPGPWILCIHWVNESKSEDELNFSRHP